MEISQNRVPPKQLFYSTKFGTAHGIVAVDTSANFQKDKSIKKEADYKRDYAKFQLMFNFGRIMYMIIQSDFEKDICASIHYADGRLTVRCREVSKPRDSGSRFSNHSRI